MNDIVERIAKAIQDAAHEPGANYASATRAAVEATREPTDSLRGIAAHIEDGPYCGFDEFWRQLIDYILSARLCGFFPACFRRRPKRSPLLR
jgi:hypothetical protein